jgi:hypothetical protein
MCREVGFYTRERHNMLSINWLQASMFQWPGKYKLTIGELDILCKDKFQWRSAFSFVNLARYIFNWARLVFSFMYGNVCGYT